MEHPKSHGGNFISEYYFAILLHFLTLSFAVRLIHKKRRGCKSCKSVLLKLDRLAELVDLGLLPTAAEAV